MRRNFQLAVLGVAPRACGRDAVEAYRRVEALRWLPARAGATGHHDVEVARLADPTGRPVALFLTLDRTLQEELKPLSAAFFLDLFKTLSQLADASPTGELGRSVTIYGDELANIGAIPKMAVWISTLRSAGVAMLLVVQATAQLVALYGEEGAATIMGSCATKIGMSGMGPEDTRLFSDLAGKTTRVSAQASKQRGRFAVVSSGGGRSQAETAADCSRRIKCVASIPTNCSPWCAISPSRAYASAAGTAIGVCGAAWPAHGHRKPREA